MLGLTSQTISAIMRIPVLIKTIQSDQSNPIYIEEEDGFSAKLSEKNYLPIFKLAGPAGQI